MNRRDLFKGMLGAAVATPGSSLKSVHDEMALRMLKAHREPPTIYITGIDVENKIVTMSDTPPKVSGSQAFIENLTIPSKSAP